MKKKVLLIYYSQSGQLHDVARSLAAPLEAQQNIDVVYECLRPVRPYPFPWPFLTFFDTFPESVHDDPAPIVELSEDVTNEEFDLVILAYQVWFLSPSQPVTAFLQSAQAQQLLKNKPVVTLIACRNMWLMAQEKVKAHLQRLGAHLVDNVVLTDPAGSAATFFSTPMWVLTGNKGPFFGGLIPIAGVSPADIAGASRFGEAIASQLPTRTASDRSPMLTGLGAVTIRNNLMASERIAIRSFRLWGALLRALGPPGGFFRRGVLLLYIVFLILMILTVVPITTLLNRLSAPLLKNRVAKLHNYYAAPSGESSINVASPHD